MNDCWGTKTPSRTPVWSLPDGVPVLPSYYPAIPLSRYPLPCLIPSPRNQRIADQRAQTSKRAPRTKWKNLHDQLESPGTREIQRKSPMKRRLWYQDWWVFEILSRIHRRGTRWTIRRGRTESSGEWGVYWVTKLTQYIDCIIAVICWAWESIDSCTIICPCSCS